jgi:hypothetical protein
MATIIFGGGASIGGGTQSSVPGSPPLQVTAGSVASITIQVNSPIQSFSPFASVQYGVSPYTYGVSSGTLPTGVTLDTTTGLVSGTPTTIQATSSVTFSVTDSTGVTSATTSTVAFTINGAITATAATLGPIGIVPNQAVSFYPFSSVTGGTLPYWYFVSSGELPDRITLNPGTGQVSGTPTQSYTTGTATFSVRDAGGVVAATTSSANFTGYQVNYLVVAGGGLGGTSGAFSCPIKPGGGGAGGLLQGTFCMGPGIIYTVQVGGGIDGTPTITPLSPSNSFSPTPTGYSSNISGSNLSTITTVGGGRGQSSIGSYASAPGGSGGGGVSTQVGSVAVGSPGIGIAGTQGYPGAAASPSQGGGGGAGGAGVNFNGGAGYTWPLNGLIYAKGGGGGGCGGGGGGEREGGEAEVDGD